MAYVKTGKPVGRPVKFNLQELGEIKSAFEEYIVNKDAPTIVGFISIFELNGKWLNKDDLRYYSEKDKRFLELINKARAKEEAWLIEQKDKPIMAIFRLKQPIFGYIDRDTGKTEVNITFSNTVPRPNRKQIKAS